MRKTPGRRFHDQNFTRFLYLFIAFFLGHFITKKFPGLISGFSGEIISGFSTTVDTIGGLGMLVFLFQVYKYFQDRKSQK